MKKRADCILKNLSAVVLIAIYLLMVIIHWFYDSFLLEDQAGLFLAMLPFIAVGFIVDFILNRKQGLEKSVKLFAKLSPAFIFLMQAVTSLLILIERDTIELFNYLIWIFLALPFFAASYQKVGHKQKLIYSLLGTGIIVAVYLYLASQSEEMNEGSGAIIYFITYFLLLYSASGIRKLPYLGMAIGLLNAAALLWLRYMPMTEATISHGWDFEMYIMMDLLILVTLVLCIIIRLMEEFQPKVANTEQAS